MTDRQEPLRQDNGLRWASDGAMVYPAEGEDGSFVADAETPGDAQRFVDWHNGALDDAERARQEAADTSGLRAAINDALTELLEQRTELGYNSPSTFTAIAQARTRVLKALDAALSQEPTPDERPLDVERVMRAWHWAFHRDRDYECANDREMAERVVAADSRARLSAAGE